MRILIAALLAVTSTLLSCGGGGGGPTPVAFTDVTMTQFRPFAEGQYVIRSRAELVAAWQAAPFQVFPIGLVTTEPTFPEYDYQTSMLVGISLGIGKWCFAPRITQVSSDGTSTDVEYTVVTASTLACMFNAPLIGFALVPTAPGLVRFHQTGT